MLPSLDTTYPTLILKASRGVIHHGALEMATDAGVSSVSTFETDSLKKGGLDLPAFSDPLS
jgi:hypothetical protein